MRLGLLTFIGILILACDGRGGAVPTSTPPPPTLTATAVPTAAPTAIPEPPDPEPSGERALNHVLALAVDIGVRPAGSTEDAEAARYIADQLRAYGYDVEDQTFPFQTEMGREVSLERISPEPATIDALSFALSPAGEVTGPLVLAGLGQPGDFPPERLEAAIALIERGGILFTDKVANAARAGASAAIIFNSEPGLYAGALNKLGDIPTVSISGDDGAALRALLEHGAVEVSLRVGPPIKGTARNVIARPAGAGGASCETVSGAHYDTTTLGPGANDNASGTAAVLELSRVVQARALSGKHCFVLFGAEEIGLVGSVAFVASLSDADRQGMKGMLNFDVVSAGDRLELIGSPQLIDIAAQAAESAGIPVDRSEELAGAGSDHQSFIAVGIPSILFLRGGGHFLSDTIHTAEDTIDIVRPDDLEEVVTLGLLVLTALDQEE